MSSSGSGRRVRLARRTGGLAARGWAATGLVVLVIAVIGLPQVLGTGAVFFWTTAIIAVLFATTVNLLFGVADIPSFGQAGFYGAGAYTVAMLAPHNVAAPLALLAGIGVGAGTAFLTSLITWRAAGLAFAMLTLAIAQAMYTLVVKTNALGGYNGLPNITPPPLGPVNLLNETNLWYFTAVCVALGLLAFWQIGRSPFGHALRSIRENPVRANYLGLNVRAYRAVAFTIAGAGAGLAGGLFGYANQIVTPNALYWTMSATPIIMLLLGGRAYFWGPAVGAVLLSWFLNYLSQVTTSYLFYIGLLLLAVLVLLPEGLLSLPAVLRQFLTRRRNRPPARPDAAPAGGPS